MFPRRHTILLALATTLVLTLLSPILGTGCGPEAPDVDKAALYTPDSLAREFALRFAALNPDARKAKPTFRSKPISAKSIADRESADQAKKKVVYDIDKMGRKRDEDGQKAGRVRY